jgi:hypothetical protein
MPTPPKAVAAADAFNRVRREIVILFLPATSMFVFVRLKALAVWSSCPGCPVKPFHCATKG